MKNWLLLIIPLLILSGCVRDDIAEPGSPAEPVINTAGAIEGHIRIKLKPEAEEIFAVTVTRTGEISTGIPELDEIAIQLGASKIERTFTHGGKYEERMRKAGLHLWYEVYFDESSPLTKAASDFSSVPGIESLEFSYPIYPIEGDITPLSADEIDAIIQTRNTPSEVYFNDPQLSRQWHYINDGSIQNSKAGSDINLAKAWAVTSGNPEVIVAIIDSGVDYGHEDLKANMWTNFAELSGEKGVDDDDNGYKDDIHGWNFFNNSSVITIGDHGTHVAGTVAAVNNNGIGVSGVAGGDGTPGSGVKLMSCQIFSNNVTNGEKSIYNAFVYAANNGAVIAQNSWGSSGPGSGSYLAAVKYFTQYAGTDLTGEVQTGPMKGGLVIFAAGNSNSPGYFYPAAFGESISVAAMTADFRKSSYSNYGTTINITAPGGDGSAMGKQFGVFSTIPGGYGYLSGTSMACPHVSGVAALMISKYGANRKGFTVLQAREMLLDAVNDLEPYLEPMYQGLMGSGYIDAYKAVSYDLGLEALPAAPSLTKSEWMNSEIVLNLKVQANEDGEIPDKYIFYYSDTDLSGAYVPKIPSSVQRIEVSTDGKSAGSEFTVRINGLTPHKVYYVLFRAVNDDETTSPHIVITSNTGADEPNTPPRLIEGKSFEDTVVDKPNSFNLDLAEYFWDDNQLTMEYTLAYDDTVVDIKRLRESIYRLKAVDTGSTTITITATDKGGLTFSTSFEYKVNTDYPEMKKEFEPYYTINSNTPVSINLDDYFTDVRGKLEYRIKSGHDLLEMNLSGADKNILGMSAKSYGSTIVMIDAVNSKKKTISVSFYVTARDNNQLVELYPNPVRDMLNIRTGSPQENITIQFYSVSGTLVMTQSVSAAPYAPGQIDVSELKSGNYKAVVRFGSEKEEHNITKL